MTACRLAIAPVARIIDFVVVPFALAGPALCDLCFHFIAGDSPVLSSVARLLSIARGEFHNKLKYFDFQKTLSFLEKHLSKNYVALFSFDGL